MVTKAVEDFRQSLANYPDVGKRDYAKAMAVEALAGMSQEERKEVIRISGGILQPSRKVSDAIWLLVVGAFAVVLLAAFIVLAIVVVGGKEAPVLLTVFTTAAGFLAGLLAPSPVKGEGE